MLDALRNSSGPSPIPPKRPKWRPSASKTLTSSTDASSTAIWPSALVATSATIPNISGSWSSRPRVNTTCAPRTAAFVACHSASASRLRPAGSVSSDTWASAWPASFAAVGWIIVFVPRPSHAIRHTPGPSSIMQYVWAIRDVGAHPVDERGLLELVPLARIETSADRIRVTNTTARFPYREIGAGGQMHRAATLVLPYRARSRNWDRPAHSAYPTLARPSTVVVLCRQVPGCTSARCMLALVLEPQLKLPRKGRRTHRQLRIQPNRPPPTRG